MTQKKKPAAVQYSVRKVKACPGKVLRKETEDLPEPSCMVSELSLEQVQFTGKEQGASLTSDRE